MPAPADGPTLDDDAADAVAAGTDEPDDETGGPAVPMPVERRRTVKREASGGRRALGAGAIAGAIALGLQEVFDPVEREEIVAIVDQGEPDPDAPVDLLYLRDQPDRSKARVRPWLLDEDPEKTS